MIVCARQGIDRELRMEIAKEESRIIKKWQQDRSLNNTNQDISSVNQILKTSINTIYDLSNCKIWI